MQLLWQDETKFATLFTKKEQNQSGSVPKAAVDRNRTGTGITTHGILSPGRLPVPPLRHILFYTYSLLKSERIRASTVALSRYVNGRRWIRTTEGSASRFTVCPLWPLGNLPIIQFNIKLYKADDRTRTDNLLITNQLLCQLSHIGITNKRIS